MCECPTCLGGATIRDQFAMAALTGFLADVSSVEIEDVAHYTALAYMYADAMLVAREGTTNARP